MTRKSIDVVTWLKNWFESKSNKVTSLSASSTDTQYPSAKAVYDEIQNNSGGCVEDYYFDTTTKEIIIDYVCGSGSGGGSSGSGGSVTIDDSWIIDSTNPVQSKIIKLALDGKAASDHTHSAYVNPTIADNLTTNDSSQVLSAKQGKILNDMIGQAISYINQ